MAVYLKEQFGLDPFLDNYIWGSADELLREIDNEFCRTDNGKTFDYKKRNFTSSHVHSMLSTAILEMIASCKIFIFIESNDSLDLNELRRNRFTTFSPWIYQELEYVKMLFIAKGQRLDEQRLFSSQGKISFLMRHEVDLWGFKRLTAASLNSLNQL